MNEYHFTLNGATHTFSAENEVAAADKMHRLILKPAGLDGIYAWAGTSPNFYATVS